MSFSPKVVVCGSASWNQIILVDHLPEPVPHMQFALASWETVGGTSAGKALHLADLDIDVRLCAPLGLDQEGGRVRRALATAGVTCEAIASEYTERPVAYPFPLQGLPRQRRTSSKPSELWWPRRI